MLFKITASSGPFYLLLLSTIRTTKKRLNSPVEIAITHVKVLNHTGSGELSQGRL